MRKTLLGIIMFILLAGACLAPLVWLRAMLETPADTTVLTATRLETAPVAAIEKADDSATVRFPALVEGTTLVAQSLAMYEGNMLEKDSEEFLADAAALEVHNFGSSEISLAEVVLEFSKSQMVFFGTNIPAGGSVLIIEQDGQSWTQEECSRCYGYVKYEDMKSLPASMLMIEDVDMGSVSVTNLTDAPLYDIWLFYKNYYPEAQLYIGGITYIQQIPALAAGETLTVALQRYAGGYSKIIKAVQIP